MSDRYDLRSQIRSYCEYVETKLPDLAPAEVRALHRERSFEPAVRRRRGLAVAAAAAAVTFLLIGGALLGLRWLPGSSAPVATIPQPRTTVLPGTTTTTTPDTTAPGEPAGSEPVSTAAAAITVDELPISPTTTIVPEALGERSWLHGDDEPGVLGGLIGDVAVADDGTVWALVFDVDYRGPLLDGLVRDLGLGSARWELVRHDGTGWDVVTNSELSPLPSWILGPRILGVRPDGSVWLHDRPPAPEGPDFLWEYRDGAWIDHTAAAHLPGDTGAQVSMACCPMGIDSDGAVWVGSEDGDPGRETSDEDRWVSRFDGAWQAIHLDGDDGYLEQWLPAEVVFTELGAGIERGGVRWILFRDLGETGIWQRRYQGTHAGSFPVDIEELEAELTCDLTWGVLDLETESLIAPDGALWTAWPCIGLTRIDALDGSMMVLADGAFHGVWRLAIAPDGTVYAGGTAGLVAFYPTPDAGVPIWIGVPGDETP